MQQQHIVTLDVSANTALTELVCYANLLADLDVSANANLEQFVCYENLLTVLDISNNTAIINFNCYDNQITVLDLTSNTALSSVSCYGNSITYLDVSNTVALTSLTCNNNALTGLSMANGNNTNIFWLNAENNPDLTCIEVDDVAYSTTNWTNIDAGASFSTDCGALVGIDNATESTIAIYPNPTNGVLNFGNLNLSEIQNINVFTTTGRLLKTFNAPTAQVNIADLPNGLYLLTIEKTDGTRSVIRVAKN